MRQIFGAIRLQQRFRQLNADWSLAKSLVLLRQERGWPLIDLWWMRHISRSLRLQRRRSNLCPRHKDQVCVWHAGRMVGAGVDVPASFCILLFMQAMVWFSRRKSQLNMAPLLALGRPGGAKVGARDGPHRRHPHPWSCGPSAMQRCQMWRW